MKGFDDQFSSKNRHFTSGVDIIKQQTILPNTNSRQLSIKVEDFHPVVLITIGGYLAQLEVYKLKSQVEGFIANGKRFIILNLSGIEYIDSAGIGALLYIRTETNRMGGDFCLVKPNNQNVVQILQLTSLQKIFTFHEDAVKALKAIREKNGLTATLADDPPAPDGLVHEKLKDYEARINRLEERLARLEKKTV